MTKHYDTLFSRLISKTIFFVLTTGMLIVSLIVCSFLFSLIHLPWAIENGYHWEGAYKKWHDAMTEGSSREAIYWAKRYEILSDSPGRDKVYLSLARAYELDRQYDIAICYYTLYNHENKGFDTVFYPQIFYFQGKKKEAFEAYCAMASAYADTRSIARYNFPRYVTGYPHFAAHPFKDYKDFLVFMEEEYENLGSPTEYAQFMNFFRYIGGLDIDKPWDSGDYDKMWETITQERDQKKE